MALTKTQLKKMIKADGIFAALVAVHGSPVSLVDCREGGHDGEICMVGRCVNGRMLVLRCDSTNGCTKYDTIEC